MVCRFHLRRHTYAFLLEEIATVLMPHVKRYVHIQGMLPVDANGVIVPPPVDGGGTTPPDTGGGGTDEGGGGTGTPPGDPGDQDPTANYVDGSCR